MQKLMLNQQVISQNVSTSQRKSQELLQATTLPFDFNICLVKQFHKEENET